MRGELNGLAAKLLLSCDSAATVETLGRRFILTSHPPRLNQPLKLLCSDRLMLEDENQFLGLPVFRQRPAINEQRLSNAYITAKPSTTDPLLRVV